MIKENLIKRNVFIYGNPATGKSLLIKDLVLESECDNTIYLVNECNEKLNMEVFGDTEKNLVVLKNYESANSILKEMIDGTITNSIIVIDNVKPFYDENETKDLILEFLSKENKNGNNLVCTYLNKTILELSKFDVILECYIDENYNRKIKVEKK